MAPRFNSASRAHKLLLTAAQQPGERPILDAWTAVFGRTSTSPFRQRIYVAEMVGKLAGELDKVHRQMYSTEYSQDLYRPVFEALEKAFDINVMSNPWQEPKQHLNQYTLNMLRMFAETLPSEGEALDENELLDISHRLDQVRAEIERSDLPEDVKDFFFEQIDLLTNAIREYKVRGNVVFGEAFNQAVTKSALNLALFQRHEADEEFQERWDHIRRTWDWVKERSNDVQALTTLYAGYKLIEQGTRAIAGLLTG